MRALDFRRIGQRVPGLMLWLVLAGGGCAQVALAQAMIDVAGFQDGSHH
jgi:hypothetical protein